jgi:uncharacterized protein YydD (DUF2326 family)
MKLSRLYSNQPNLFDAIDFASGLNVVLAQIRLPENMKKDTHNLGKTTIGRLIDFCFLSKRDDEFFLFRQPSLFGDFVFFLEVELLDGGYLTIRRGVREHSKISLKRHAARAQDLSELSEEFCRSNKQRLTKRPNCWRPSISGARTSKRQNR